MKKANYVVLDCETGGLDATKNPILEIALVILDTDLNEVLRYETYIKPYDSLEVTKEALRANGIKMQEVEKSGISKKEAQANIVSVLRKSMGGSHHPSRRPVVVGHNINFDIDFLIEFFKGSKFNWKDLVYDIYIDTQADAKRAFPNAPNLQLGTCCEMAGVKLIGAHRAMPDTLATADLFRFFCGKLSTKNTQKEEAKISKLKTRKTFQF